MSANVLSKEMYTALRQVCSLLHNLQGKWLVGGSCGLALRQIALSASPRDLDIYADDPVIDTIADLLKDYAIDQPHYSETSIYRSILSHYVIDGVQIELVGGFKVNSSGSAYHVEVNEVMNRYSVDYVDEDMNIKLMPLAHELVFNLLRNREDRYEAIAKVMRDELELYVPALQEIISRNQFSGELLTKLSRLLALPYMGG